MVAKSSNIKWNYNLLASHLGAIGETQQKF
jgi:hypothetical protein